jgi:hypothetical protein
MTASDLLSMLRNRGVELLAHNGRLRWRPREGVSPEERGLLTRHKAELLKMIPAQATPLPPTRPSAPSATSATPWDQAEADALVADVQARRRELFGETGWPDEEIVSCQLRVLMDTIDAAWEACDLPRLCQAVEELRLALNAVRVMPGVDEDEADTVARALGLPPGSVALWEPHRCNSFCRCRTVAENKAR